MVHLDECSLALYNNDMTDTYEDVASAFLDDYLHHTVYVLQLLLIVN